MPNKDTTLKILMAVRGIIVDDNDKVLLLKRSMHSLYHPGKWELPGGKVFGAHNLQDEIEATVNRETNVIVTVQVQDTYTQSRIVTEGGKYSGYLYVETTATGEYIAGKVKINPKDHTDYIWVEKQQAFELDLSYESKKSLSNYYYTLNKDLKKVMVTLVARALVKKDNKYLLIRRSPEDVFEGQWELPGGKINAFENVETLLKREVFEETNLLINIERGNIYTDSRVETQGRHKGRTYVSIFNLTSIKGGNIKLSEDHDKYGWFTQDQILKLNLAPQHKLALTEIFIKHDLL